MALPQFYPYDQTPRSEYDAMGGQGNSPLAAGFRALAQYGKKNAPLNAASEPIRAATEVTLALPPATANAVAGANAAMPTDTRARGSIGYGPGVTARGLNPVAETDTGIDGITKYQGLRGGPVYTNKGMAGYEEIRDMRAPLPSVAGVLRNVPEMPSVLYPQRQRAAQPSDAGLMFSTDGGNGTGNPFGLVGSRRAPAMEDPRIAALDSRIDSYMSSGSIFDMWRGRQLMKRRDALAGNVLDQQQLGQQGENAALQFRGTQLSADAQRYATDVGARERKYVADVGAMTREREMQAGLLPHMADIQMGKRIERLIKEGRYEEAKMLKTLGAPSQPRTAAQPTLDVTGGKGLFVGIDPATNKPYAVSGEQLLQQQLEEERNRRHEALVGGR